MNIELLKSYKDKVDTLQLELTPRQTEILSTVIASGSNTAAAKLLNISPRTINNSISQINIKAASVAYAPNVGLNGILPSNQMLKGASVFFGVDKDTGETKVRGYWAKGNTVNYDELIQTVLTGIKDTIPRLKPSPKPKHVVEDLVSEYILTDYHLGMLAWSGETKDRDWDLDIAESTLMKWIDYSITVTPNTKTGVLVQLGDFLHYDGLKAVTPASGHVLDTDTRFTKLVRSGVRVLRYVIERMLTKHEEVHVIMAEGNHDEASSVWLREIFNVLYENDPRVTVDTSANPYYGVQFGKVALFYHHGHKRPITRDVDRVFAASFPEIFGTTKYRYAALGHYHNDIRSESPLMVLNQYRTLAPADAYSAKGGWLSGSDSKVNVYHKEHGKLTEHTITPCMFE